MKGRFFVELDAQDPDRARLDAAGARHLRALRLTPGDEVCAIVGPGRERAAVIEQLGRERVVLALGAELPPAGRDPVAQTTLALALGDLARMDLVVEKATELGATAIQPFVAERSQARGVAPPRLERWRRIARAACEQCGRTREPEVRRCVDFGTLVRALEGSHPVWLLAPSGAPAGGSPALAARRAQDPPLAIVVGPEGGLSEGEAAELLARGAEAVRLGRTTLRFETAAIAGLAAAAALSREG
ncbi:MAG: RsmE family RNA methyltransferase [Thermodesulfobacteriota bacterium]